MGKTKKTKVVPDQDPTDRENLRVFHLYLKAFDLNDSGINGYHFALDKVIGANRLTLFPVEGLEDPTRAFMAKTRYKKSLTHRSRFLNRADVLRAIMEKKELDVVK